MLPPDKLAAKLDEWAASIHESDNELISNLRDAANMIREAESVIKPFADVYWHNTYVSDEDDAVYELRKRPYDSKTDGKDYYITISDLRDANDFSMRILSADGKRYSRTSILDEM